MSLRGLYCTICLQRQGTSLPLLQPVATMPVSAQAGWEPHFHFNRQHCPKILLGLQTQHILAPRAKLLQDNLPFFAFFAFQLQGFRACLSGMGRGGYAPRCSPGFAAVKVYFSEGLRGKQRKIFMHFQTQVIFQFFASVTLHVLTRLPVKDCSLSCVYLMPTANYAKKMQQQFN